MNNWIGPTVKQVWNIAMHVLHNFFGLLKTQQLTHLGRYSLHLLTYLSVCHCLFFVALVWSFRTLLFVFVSYFYLSFLQHFLIEYLCNTQFVLLPLKVRERGNRKENCKIAKMLLDVVTFSWKIISNKFERRSIANVDKVI